ncbi:MAG: DUF364 domain-containing protein [Sulfolobaceae archaeon]|nr:DUF364 domain-containing protein [Sulfolobaceae archaeon]
MILEDIINELSFMLKQRTITNICVGIMYTAATLDNGSLGISHTVPEGEVTLSGEIVGKNAYEVVQELSTPLSRSVALAILNALGDLSQYEKGDPLDLISANKVCLFGYSPNVSNLKFNSIVVYDFYNPQPQKMNNVDIRPYSSFKGETCDTAVVFGSALVNGAFDNIVRNVNADNFILTGVSSVDAPSTLHSLGFNIIGKIIATDKYRALRTVCEGGNSGQLGKYTMKVFKRL